MINQPRAILYQITKLSDFLDRIHARQLGEASIGKYITISSRISQDDNVSNVIGAWLIATKVVAPQALLDRRTGVPSQRGR